MKRYIIFTFIFLTALLFTVSSSSPSSLACQVENCQICSSLGLCVMCHKNYILSINKQLSTSSCVESQCKVDNCFRCLDMETCVQCWDGYRVGALGKCERMDAEPERQREEGKDERREEIREGVKGIGNGCEMRNGYGECVLCEYGYVMRDGECVINLLNFAVNNNLQACTPTVLNCISCLTPNFCTQCSNNLIPNAQGNACISNCSTTITNCQLCSGSTVCLTCANGYTLFTSGTLAQSCVICNITGCSACSSTGVCQTCYQGYTLNATTLLCDFTGCQFPCATGAGGCSQTNASQCLSCQTPFFNSQPFANGTCFTCSVANCLSCFNTSLNLCSQCQSNYTLSSDNTSCIWGCASNVNGYLCTSCTGTTCLACVAGYAATGGVNGCTQCAGTPICISCSVTNTSVCTGCIAGYYVNSVGSCTACQIVGCATCYSNGTCFQFMNGYLSYTTNPTAPETPVSYAYICDPGCQSCLSNYPLQCLQCSPGYYMTVPSLTNNLAQCQPCLGNCMTCNPANISQCYTCFSNSFLVNSTCYNCTQSSNCLTCSSSNLAQCTSCPYGYLLASTSSSSVSVCTTPCPPNCQTCTSIPSSSSLSSANPYGIACSSCQVGFGLSYLATCLPCMINCRICSGQFMQICNLCGLGFYVNSNYSCSACASGCSYCTALGCVACASGYNIGIINGQTVCVRPSVFPCVGNNITNPTQCLTCAFGYYLSNGGCVVNTTSTTTSALYCGLGTYLNTTGTNQQCQTCPGANCWRCLSTNTSFCIACAAGYYLDPSTNQCNLCSSFCQTCSSLNTCTSCNYNYTLVSQPMASNQQTCVPCALPCLQCQGNPVICTTCIPGFTFTGWNCVSNFYYLFSISLAANQQTFFQNYQSFISRLTYAMQTINQKSISITSLSPSLNSNNTFVTARLSTIQAPDSDPAAYEFNNLYFALMNQDTFGNMNVLNSSLSAQNGTIPTLGSNLPFILGIVIPVGALIIFLIVYFICSRNNMDLPGHDYQPMEEGRAVESTEMKSL